MKTPRVIFASLTLGAFAALPVAVARDPFWPINYEPPKPEPTASEKAVAQNYEPPQPPKPVERTITEADWTAAKKALVISGYTQTVRPDNQEPRMLAMVNRRTVAPGDTVTLVHQDVRFLWRAETITDRSIQLVPLTAERVAPKPPALNQ